MRRTIISIIGITLNLHDAAVKTILLKILSNTIIGKCMYRIVTIEYISINQSNQLKTADTNI